jgi:hypothetical protein
MFTKGYFIKLAKASGIRVVKTMAETALAIIGTNTMGITDVDWLGLLSACALSGVITMLTCLRGLPEIDIVSEDDQWH